MAEPLVAIDNVSVHFPLKSAHGLRKKTHYLHAVDNVTLSIPRSETLGVVGESGSGKSTLGRAILRRVKLSSGSIRFRGEDITNAEGERLRQLRRHMQMVFQDPYASLNPRMKVLDLVAEPLLAHGIVRKESHARDRVAKLLQLTGLPSDALDRYPHAFSGGQRQRIGIARALALDPDLIVADEPVSALDVSIQAQVVNLFQDLQDRLGLTYFFIAHDVNVIRHISNRIAVMYAGQLVELGSREDIFHSTAHPYTQALLSAVPVPDPEIEDRRERIVIRGELNSQIDPGEGCRFYARCPHADPSICPTVTPPLVGLGEGHWSACHFADRIVELPWAARS